MQVHSATGVTGATRFALSILALAGALLGAGCGGDGDAAAGPDATTALLLGGGGGTAAAADDPGDGGTTLAYGTASDVFTGYQAPAGAEWYEETWPDGNLKSRGYAFDPEGYCQRVGPFESWYANGVKESEGAYDANGMRTGYWHFWHDNGQLAEEGFYVEDELDRSRFYVRRAADGTWLGGANPPADGGIL